VSANIEDPIAGVPLLQTQNSREAFQALRANLGAQGNATVKSRTEAEYVIEYTYNGSSFRRVTNPVDVPVTAVNYQVGGAGGDWGNGFVIRLASRNFGEMLDFVFVYQIDIYGVRVQSTDQVAYFQGYGRGLQILRVGYRSQNPTLVRFNVEDSEFGSLWSAPYSSGYGLPQIHVESITLNTTFQYATGGNPPR